MNAYANAVVCPVCSGKGFVPQGFYAPFPERYTGVSPDVPLPCRACSGKGFVWDRHDPPYIEYKPICTGTQI